jgi:hypothetical protein
VKFHTLGKEEGKIKIKIIIKKNTGHLIQFNKSFTIKMSDKKFIAREHHCTTRGQISKFSHPDIFSP